MRRFRRETLHEQLLREAGLAPQPEPRRRTLRTVWAGRPGHTQRKLGKHLGEQEAARIRESPRLNAPDTPPPGFG
jgi:hypothetical protein